MSDTADPEREQTQKPELDELFEPRPRAEDDPAATSEGGLIRLGAAGETDEL